jgi:uncharacterized cupredoxin-like copper-binding protein
MRTTAKLFTLALLLLVLAGCGNGTGPTAAPATATVTLDDDLLQEGEASLRASPPTVPAGPVTFAMSNTGGVPHEVKLILTDEPAGGLALDAFGVVDEEKYEVLPIAFASSLPVGGSTSVTKDVPPGRYVMICNLQDHYSSGMFQEFTTS